MSSLNTVNLALMLLTGSLSMMHPCFLGLDFLSPIHIKNLKFRNKLQPFFNMLYDLTLKGGGEQNGPCTEMYKI